MNEEKFDLRFMGKLDLQQIERATQYQRRTRLGGRLISLSLFFIIMYFLIYKLNCNIKCIKNFKNLYRQRITQ